MTVMVEQTEGGIKRGGPLEPEGTATPADSAAILLRRARSGDQKALDALYSRFLPPLRRWATGRLPPWARALVDTDDILQESFVNTIGKVDLLETRTDFQAYLRQAVLNRIRDEIRRAHKTRSMTTLDGSEPDTSPTPLEQLLGREALDRYESALGALTPEQREAVVGRVELRLSYEDLADFMGKPSPDAARMVVSRALVRLAKEMGRDD